MKEPILVVSFNVRNGRALDGANSWPFRRRWVPEYVASLGADVIGLQEAYCNQALAFEKALNGHVRVGVGRDNGKTRGEFCPIYVRSSRLRILDQGTFWFSDTPDEPGSCTWGNTLPRICTWALLAGRDGELLRVCNLHLDHASPHARLKSAEMVRRRIAEWGAVCPVVVMGDFNAGERDAVITSLLAEPDGLRDTLRVVHPEAVSVATFHAWEGRTDGARIDYILATSDVHVLAADIRHDTVAGRLPSDHWPVTAVIEISPRQPIGEEARS